MMSDGTWNWLGRKAKLESLKQYIEWHGNDLKSLREDIDALLEHLGLERSFQQPKPRFVPKAKPPKTDKQLGIE